MRRFVFGVIGLFACGDDGSAGDATDATTAGGTSTTATTTAGSTSTTTVDSTSDGGTTDASTGGGTSTTGGESGGSGSSTGAVGPDCDIGEPLDVPDDTWTTVMDPSTACGNAGEAGFVVNPSARGANLVIFFQGGGACFNQGDCGASNLGGFTPAEGVSMAQGLPPFARDNPNNPFADWDYVFVPYCTGDFHSGDNVATYGTNHVGYSNMTAFLTRIVPTFCDAERVVVTGTSAGGFGAAFNYAQIHELYGSATQVDLIADSGPYMTTDWMPTVAQDMIDGNWGFRTNMPAGCTACSTGWDALYTHIAERWPDDRMSFLSYTHDPSIQGRFDPYTPLDDLDAFELAINALADDVLVPLPNFRVFFVDGTGHVLMNGGFAISQGGTALGDFIDAQLAGDAGWADVRP